MDRPASLEIHPLDRKRWKDLEQLFNGPGGAQVRGCWCMYYRRSGRAEKPADMTYAQFNKCALKALVDSGIAPGLIGYRDGEPIAWVSLGPREDYAKLARSSVMKPVDDKPVWSVVCFYVAKEARGEHLAELMLKSAIEYARSHGARLIERTRSTSTNASATIRCGLALRACTTVPGSSRSYDASRRDPSCGRRSDCKENPEIATADFSADWSCSFTHAIAGYARSADAQRTPSRAFRPPAIARQCWPRFQQPFLPMKRSRRRSIAESR